MQAVPSSPNIDRSGLTVPARSHRARRAAAQDVHRVLIRIPDLREPRPADAIGVLPALPKGDSGTSYVVHAAHGALEPHLPHAAAPRAPSSQTTIASPSTGSQPTVSSAPLAEIPWARPIVIGQPTIAPVEPRQPAATAERLQGSASAVREWVSQVDHDRLRRAGRTLITIGYAWQWLVRPKVIVTAVAALILQLSGIALLLEMNPTTSTSPPSPQSSLTPGGQKPATTKQPVGENPLPLHALPGTLPADELPAPQVPVMTPLTDPTFSQPGAVSAPAAPRFQTTPRLGNPQDKLPWEETPLRDVPIATPLAPEASAVLPESKQRVATLPLTPASTITTPALKKARFTGAIEPPRTEDSR